MTDIKTGDNKFFIGENEAEPLAYITYVPSGEDRIIIDHTEVSDELGGQGVGGKLVKKVVAYARENNKIVIPLCPFAKSYIEKHPELQDVLE